MGSSWGKSWGSSWGNSWGDIEFVIDDPFAFGGERSSKEIIKGAYPDKKAPRYKNDDHEVLLISKMFLRCL